MAPYKNSPLSFETSTTPLTDGKDRSPLQQAPPKPFQHTGWARLALSCMPDFLHVVSLDGRIQYVTDSCRTVVGYERSQLLSRVVHDFVHPEELTLFAREFTQIALHGIPTRFIYRFRAYDQSYVILESQCNIYKDPSPFSGQRSLIINARPYNTRTNFLLDSFLEHKIMHDTLERQKIDLESESAEDDDSQTSVRVVESDPKTVDGVIVGFSRPQGFSIHPKQLKPHVQLEFAYFEPQGHLADAIPVIPHDQHMSDVSSDEHELIGDLGIPFSRKTRNGVSKKKKKVQKSKMTYICMVCSTTQSPEWRRGPQGPKTLCNSCGLRWAKSDRTTKVPLYGFARQSQA